jgi:hypothetical protein
MLCCLLDFLENHCHIVSEEARFSYHCFVLPPNTALERTGVRLVFSLWCSAAAQLCRYTETDMPVEVVCF